MYFNKKIKKSGKIDENFEKITKIFLKFQFLLNFYQFVAKFVKKFVEKSEKSLNFL